MVRLEEGGEGLRDWVIAKMPSIALQSFVVAASKELRVACAERLAQGQSPTKFELSMKQLYHTG